MVQDRAVSNERAELEAGLSALQSGRLQDARACFLQIVAAAPQSVEGWHYLGVVELKSRRPARAAECFSESLRIQPQNAEARAGLGIALRQTGRIAEAAAAFEQALAARPRYLDAALNLAGSREMLGDLQASERIYRDVLGWKADCVPALRGLGRLLCRQSRQAQALPLFRAAQRHVPADAQANGDLAVLLVELDRPAEAESYARQALLAAPDAAPWWRTLGIAQRLQRHNDEAIASLRKAIELAPEDSLALAELGAVLAEDGLVDEARAAFASVKPAAADAERLRWALNLSLPSIYSDEAHVDRERQRFAAGLENVAGGLRLDTPQHCAQAYNALAHSSTYLLHYQARDNTQLQIAFGDLADRVMLARVPALMEPCPWRPRAAGVRTRVGIVSSHLMHHTVSRYFGSLILGLDPREFEVQVWYGGGVRDFSTERIERHVERFAAHAGDALELAGQIRRAQLDVLVYAEIGMDPRHHVLAALRLAPVQCALYGHPATSGLANVDYFLSGAMLEPDDAHTHYRERLIRLPGLGATPTAPPPPGASIETFADSRPLLLCLQTPLKITPAFDRVLATIAAQTGARIGFSVRQPGIGRLFKARIEAEFARAGLDPDKALALLPVRSHESFLGTIAASTLVLDTPGFSGGATSLDALSVGTPVLAFDGAMARGRQTSAMLRMLGCTEQIAIDDGTYIEKASALCRDAERLAGLRKVIGARARELFEDEAPIRAFSEFLRSAAPI